MDSELVSPIIAPTTDTPVAAVMLQVQALTAGLSTAETLEVTTMMAAGFSTADSLELAATVMADAMGGLNPHLRSDDDLLALLGSMEAVGRLTDAGRVALAADVEVRSDTRIQTVSLARTRGSVTGTDLITTLTRVSAREVKRRVTLGEKTRVRQMGGSMLPPRYPVVADALSAGTLGVDAAEAIVTGLSDLPSYLDPADVEAAERGLVSSATGAITAENEGLPNAGFAFSADLIRGQMLQWKALLDPDGTAPTEGTVLAARSSFGFGQFRDGLYPLRGGVTPELRGIMNGIFDTYLSAHAQPVPAEPGRFPTADEQAHHDAEERARIEAGEVIPGADQLDALDTRTGGEKRAD
ncbi:DUF222 domain-containing protein, partial [Leifsonia kafniensis]